MAMQVSAIKAADSYAGDINALNKVCNRPEQPQQGAGGDQLSSSCPDAGKCHKDWLGMAEKVEGIHF